MRKEKKRSDFKGENNFKSEINMLERTNFHTDVKKIMLCWEKTFCDGIDKRKFEFRKWLPREKKNIFFKIRMNWQLSGDRGVCDEQRRRKILNRDQRLRFREREKKKAFTFRGHVVSQIAKKYIFES